MENVILVFLYSCRFKIYKFTEAFVRYTVNYFRIFTRNLTVNVYSTDTVLWFYSKIRDFTWTNTVNIYSEDGV